MKALSQFCGPQEPNTCMLHQSMKCLVAVLVTGMAITPGLHQ